VVSEASLQSEWVMTELRKARKAERQSGQRKLFPVRLVDMETIKAWECFDADSGKDLAVELPNTSSLTSRTGRSTTPSRPPSPTCSRT
jgi:hypothetical protein